VTTGYHFWCMTHDADLSRRLEAYALGLPDADPDGRLLAHLDEGCATCAGRLESIRDTLGTVALGVKRQEPPPSLRARILDRFRRERFVVVRAGDGTWDAIGPGARAKALFRDEAEGWTTLLVRLDEGRRLAEVATPDDVAYVLVQGQVEIDGTAMGLGALVSANDTVARARAAGDSTLLVIRGGLREPGAFGASYVAVESSRWIHPAPGMSVHPLAGDRTAGAELMLVRMDPGSVLPEHHHGGCEEVFLLEGSCVSEGQAMSAGDYHRAPFETEHAPTTTATGCTMVVINRYPVRLAA
jgi:quercetin dioxygenase-like cupin family protein